MEVTEVKEFQCNVVPAHQEVWKTAEFAFPDLEQLTKQRVCCTHLHGYWGSPTAQQNQLPASYPKL